MVTCDGAGASHDLITRLDKLAARPGLGVSARTHIASPSIELALYLLEEKMACLIHRSAVWLAYAARSSLPPCE